MDEALAVVAAMLVSDCINIVELPAYAIYSPSEYTQLSWLEWPVQLDQGGDKAEAVRGMGSVDSSK